MGCKGLIVILTEMYHLIQLQINAYEPTILLLYDDNWCAVL